MDAAKARRVARYIFLGVVALTVFVIYGRILFPGFTFLFEHFLEAELHWDRAPLWESLFLFGVGLLAAIVATVGVNNLLLKRQLFAGISWVRVLSIVFCCSMLMALVGEADDLISKYALVPEDGEDATNPMLGIALLIVVLVGYAMWPKSPPEAGRRSKRCLKS